MAIPELERRRAEKLPGELCERRVLQRVRHQVRLSLQVRGNSIIISEHRPHFPRPEEWTGSPIARFRYDTANNVWALFWRDRNARWHSYDPALPTADIAVLVQELDEGPTGIFWG